MLRYYSHTLILPDGTCLDDFVVQITGAKVSYFPFKGEIHSTIYVETPILLNYRADLQGKAVVLGNLPICADSDSEVYAYVITPSPSCVDEFFVEKKLKTD